MRHLFVLATAVLALVGCQTVVVSRSVEITDFVSSRIERNYLEPSVSKANPGDAFVSVERLFETGRPEQFASATEIGNFMLSEWPQDERAASVANRLAWCSLFLVQDVTAESPYFFQIYGENLYNFSRSLFYADLSARLDSGRNRYWTGRAAQLVEIIDGGYQNPAALTDFAETQILIQILAPRERDESYFAEALVNLKDIQARYRDWLPHIIDQEIRLTREMLE